MLQEEENVIHAFQVGRDMLAFTTKRVLTRSLSKAYNMLRVFCCTFSSKSSQHTLGEPVRILICLFLSQCHFSGHLFDFGCFVYLWKVVAWGL